MRSAGGRGRWDRIGAVGVAVVVIGVGTFACFDVASRQAEDAASIDARLRDVGRTAEALVRLDERSTDDLLGALRIDLRSHALSGSRKNDAGVDGEGSGTGLPDEDVTRKIAATLHRALADSPTMTALELWTAEADGVSRIRVERGSRSAVRDQSGTTKREERVDVFGIQKDDPAPASIPIRPQEVLQVA